MERHEQLIAYLATLGALVIVYIASLLTGAIAPGVMGKFEAFGLGTITGGLIGVLSRPQARTTQVGPNENVDVKESTQ